MAFAHASVNKRLMVHAKCSTLFPNKQHPSRENSGQNSEYTGTLRLPTITANAMVHTLSSLHESIDALCQQEPLLRPVVDRIGYPEPRVRPRGYETLLRTIVGQQVSTAAAAAVWGRLESLIGSGCPPENIIAQNEDALRVCGLSRQKQSYARSLAELVLSGTLDLHALPTDDEAAIDLLIQVKGIGRWSAEIYLLFAEGRPDIWPAGDLAVRIAAGEMMGIPDRPSESDIRNIAENWRPHRSAAAILAWHHYNGATL